MARDPGSLIIASGQPSAQSIGVLITAETVAAEQAAAEAFASQEKAASTRRAYRSDWAIFKKWCAARGATSLPAAPEIVAVFLASQATAGIGPSTLTRRAAAIRYAHLTRKHETPTTSEGVRAVLRGIRRSRGAAVQKKHPATASIIKDMLATCSPDTLRGKRDRALLALGFAGAFRRSELVALTVADLEHVNEGMRVYIAKSKTDQESRGATVAIPATGALKTVASVKQWLEAAQITSGPIFRPINRHGQMQAQALTDTSAAQIVKTHAALAGYDPALFAGHSLRRGFLTSAAEAGASIAKMKEVSRHKSVDVLMGYLDAANRFKDHAGETFL